jgi:hypothetical protein
LSFPATRGRGSGRSRRSGWAFTVLENVRQDLNFLDARSTLALSWSLPILRFYILKKQLDCLVGVLQKLLPRNSNFCADDKATGHVQ